VSLGNHNFQIHCGPIWAHFVGFLPHHQLEHGFVSFLGINDQSLGYLVLSHLASVSSPLGLFPLLDPILGDHLSLLILFLIRHILFFGLFD
jgi:hypothetical protein